jgi:hypothetical protein
MHYRIRWSDPSGETPTGNRSAREKSAQSAAIQLKRPAETYAIVQFDGDCPRLHSGPPTEAGNTIAVPTA